MLECLLWRQDAWAKSRVGREKQIQVLGLNFTSLIFTSFVLRFLYKIRHTHLHPLCRAPVRIVVGAQYLASHWSLPSGSYLIISYFSYYRHFINSDKGEISPVCPFIPLCYPRWVRRWWRCASEITEEDVLLTF